MISPEGSVVSDSVSFDSHCVSQSPGVPQVAAAAGLQGEPRARAALRAHVPAGHQLPRAHGPLRAAGSAGRCPSAPPNHRLSPPHTCFVDEAHERKPQESSRMITGSNLAKGKRTLAARRYLRSSSNINPLWRKRADVANSFQCGFAHSCALLGSMFKEKIEIKTPRKHRGRLEKAQKPQTPHVLHERGH